MNARPEDAIFDILSNDAALVALVGDRIYPGMATDKPDGPYIMFQLISNNPLNSIGGDCGLDTGRYQFDCYGMNLTEAGNIKGALRAVLSGFRGWRVGAKINFIKPDADFYEYSDGVAMWRWSQDMIVTYEV